MGRGVAYQATGRYEGIAEELGKSLIRVGNIPVLITENIITFPVKNHWQSRANINLIRTSAKILDEWTRRWNDKTFVIPRPGCGNGRLRWEEDGVKQIMMNLPDNVYVIQFEKGKEY